MIVNRKLVWVIWGAVLGLFLVWWFVIVDLLNSPHSPRAGILYVTIVLVSSSWHVRALLRFSKMTKLLRAEESAGLAPAGSTTFAANQRFRYMVRSIESIIVLTVGILAIWAAYEPSITLNPNYFRLVITYFIGSIALTGFLTIRDLWVLNRVRQLTEAEDDSATLTTIKHDKKENSNR